MVISFSQAGFIQDFVRAFKSEVLAVMSNEASAALTSFAEFVTRELDADPPVSWDPTKSALVLASGRSMVFPKGGVRAYPSGMLPPSVPSVHVFNVEQHGRSTQAPHVAAVDYSTRR